LEPIPYGRQARATCKTSKLATVHPELATPHPISYNIATLHNVSKQFSTFLPIYTDTKGEGKSPPLRRMPQYIVCMHRKTFVSGRFPIPYGRNSHHTGIFFWSYFKIMVCAGTSSVGWCHDARPLHHSNVDFIAVSIFSSWKLKYSKIYIFGNCRST
jgi:hypothetical protein